METEKDTPKLHQFHENKSVSHVKKNGKYQI